MRSYIPPNQLFRPVDVARRLHYSTAEAAYRTVLVLTGSEGWQSINDVQRFRISAHEYFHVLQLEALGPSLSEQIAATRLDRLHSGGPVWLFEGAAEYVSWLVIRDAGLADIRAHLRSEAEVGAREPLSLASLEVPIDYAQAREVALSHSLLAVTLLMAGRPLDDLFAFYEHLGKGRDWREAFSLAFGLSAAEFYGRYQAFAASGYAGL